MSPDLTAPPPDGETVVAFDAPFDLPRTLSILQRGVGDPALRIDPGQHRGGPGGTPGAGAWAGFRLYLPDSTQEPGQVLLRLDQVAASQVRARVWCRGGPRSSTMALARVPALLGAGDDWSEFDKLLEAMGDSMSQALARVRRRHPGVRLPANGQLLDQLVTVTLEQKVTHDQARHSWRRLLQRFGDHPGGPAPAWMRLAPTAAQLRSVPSWSWHQMWVQPPMAATVIRLARRAAALHRLARTATHEEALAELGRRLQSIDGVGQWTVAEVLQRTHGAADLPAVGDYHLPALVGEALTGHRTDDAGMLAALQPWQGHRQRVVRLIHLSGYRHQARGPRLAPVDHRGR